MFAEGKFGESGNLVFVATATNLPWQQRTAQFDFHSPDQHT